MEGTKHLRAVTRRLGEFTFSPIAEMRRLTVQKPDWLLAIVPTILCTSMQLASAATVAWKIAPHLEEHATRLKLASHGLTTMMVVSVINAAASYPILFVVSAMCLVAMEVAFHDGGTAKRLVEAAGVSMLTQIPNCFVVLVLALSWRPVRESAEVLNMGNLAQPVNLGAALSTMVEIAGTLSSAWLIFMLLISLRIVAQMRLRSIAVGVGILIVVAGSARFLMIHM